MHYLNELLPVEEKQFLENDDQASLKRINFFLEEIAAWRGEVVSQPLIAGLIRLIRIRKSLKYEIDVCRIIVRYDCSCLLIRFLLIGPNSLQVFERVSFNIF